MVRYVGRVYDFAFAIRENAKDGKGLVITGDVRKIKSDGNPGSVTYGFDAFFDGKKLPWHGGGTEQIRYAAPEEEIDFLLVHVVDSRDAREGSGVDDFISQALEYVRKKVNEEAPGLPAFVEGNELFVNRRR